MGSSCLLPWCFLYLSPQPIAALMIQALAIPLLDPCALPVSTVAPLNLFSTWYSINCSACKGYFVSLCFAFWVAPYCLKNKVESPGCGPTCLSHQPRHALCPSHRDTLFSNSARLLYISGDFSGWPSSHECVCLTLSTKKILQDSTQVSPPQRSPLGNPQPVRVTFLLFVSSRS